MFQHRNTILFSTLIFLVVLSSLLPVNAIRHGIGHTALEVLKGFLITLSWFTLYSLIKVSIFARYPACL